MGLKKTVSIRQALQHVADNPMVNTDMILDVPAHELVCRTLFDIANGADLVDRPSQSRANVARKLIFDRLVGRRRAGTHPATRQTVSLEFTDLTVHQVGDGDD
jgi:hypothetical protein